jgi:hypothetical protein
MPSNVPDALQWILPSPFAAGTGPRPSLKTFNLYSYSVRTGYHESCYCYCLLEFVVAASSTGLSMLRFSASRPAPFQGRNKHPTLCSRTFVQSVTRHYLVQNNDRLASFSFGRVCMWPYKLPSSRGQLRTTGRVMIGAPGVEAPLT